MAGGNDRCAVLPPATDQAPVQVRVRRAAAGTDKKARSKARLREAWWRTCPGWFIHSRFSLGSVPCHAVNASIDQRSNHSASGTSVSGWLGNPCVGAPNWVRSSRKYPQRCCSVLLNHSTQRLPSSGVSNQSASPPKNLSSINE